MDLNLCESKASLGYVVKTLFQTNKNTKSNLQKGLGVHMPTHTHTSTPSEDSKDFYWASEIKCKGTQI